MTVTFNIDNIKANNIYQGETINVNEKSNINLIEDNIEHIYHLVGEHSFGNLDERSLKKLNLQTTRINDKETFLFILEQKNFNQYLHFSGHSSKKELIMSDGTIACEDLPDLILFNIVLLASCKNFYIAECFAKISTHVVFFLEEIENVQTSQLTKEFWQSVQTKSIEESVSFLKNKYDIGKYIYYI